MNSFEPSDSSPFADLTGRARIRDAALALFAERGVERTTLRDIARSAGLSAGLVRHHFGSKEGLRACCDDYALERLMAVKEAGVRGGRLADPGFLFERQPELLVLHRYLARSVVDGSPAAQAVLERMIVLGEQWIAEQPAGEVGDERAVACVLAAAQIGLLMVHEQISGALGVDVFSPQGHLRLAHALIDFYSTPLLSSDQAADAHAALDQLQRQTAQTPQARA
jgi:TetR/AcrR family transcriptional regulator, regulator of cefoperazone and chloramphenicol sensitivity